LNFHHGVIEKVVDPGFGMADILRQRGLVHISQGHQRPNIRFQDVIGLQVVAAHRRQQIAL
jgi:hypothetical protein